ncbi:MAG: sodium-dependent transporter [Ruthenibacterium lactatiformans]
MQQNQPANFKTASASSLPLSVRRGHGQHLDVPYRVGQYGGAAFLLIYFGFVALFGWVGLSGEFAFGRLTGTGPIGSYAYALRSRGKKGGGVLGAIPLLGSLGIAIGYAVIVGWVVRYCWGAVSGSLFAVGSEEYFGQITGPFGSLLWHGVVVLVTVLVLARGVLQGIEKVNRIIMPAFFVLFLVVAVYVGFLPGAAEGYRYLLIPQWEKLLDPMTWVMAMGQAFFSLSITGSGMIIYGSYLSKKEDIPAPPCRRRCWTPARLCWPALASFPRCSLSAWTLRQALRLFSSRCQGIRTDAGRALHCRAVLPLCYFCRYHQPHQYV